MRCNYSLQPILLRPLFRLDPKEDYIFMNQIAFARKHNLPASLTIPLKEDVMVVLRLIPPGVFKMGSAPEADGRYEREDPQHLVEIKRPFYLG